MGEGTGPAAERIAVAWVGFAVVALLALAAILWSRYGADAFLARLAAPIANCL